MTSPELLRRYPFFGLLSAKQLQSLAKIAQEVYFETGELIFEENEPADDLYFLEEGSIDLFYNIFDNHGAPLNKEIPVCSINPGEPFSISALIEPYILTASAYSSKPSRVIRFDALALRQLFEQDCQVELILMRRIVQAAMERLHATRLQLALSWA